jgi:hypothetical protein
MGIRIALTLLEALMALLFGPLMAGTISVP